jgi:hypothetical protein
LYARVYADFCDARPEIPDLPLAQSAPDPHNEENAEWSLAVFDRNIGEWVNMNLCTRPGEDSYLTNIEVIEDEASS